MVDMAPQHSLSTFCLLLTIVSWGSAIHCNCEGAVCTKMSSDACPVGTTQDLCSCCTVCAGAAGEECGGPWGIYGDCGTGLECRQDHCPPGEQDLECYHHYLTEPGQCVEKRRRSMILDVLAGPDRMRAAGTGNERGRRRLELLHQLENLMK